MERQYVALLRAISNVRMEPFREAMEALGFTDVASYGMSGNFLFNAGGSDTEAMERCTAERFNTAAFVRNREEMATIVAEDPFNSTVMFLARAPGIVQRTAFLDLEFETPTPVLRATTVYFVHPARLVGKRSPFDFEDALDVEGTARSARVVSRLLDWMSHAARS
jgi:uncharacterized protein (DUF1697 family)